MTQSFKSLAWRDDGEVRERASVDEDAELRYLEITLDLNYAHILGSCGPGVLVHFRGVGRAHVNYLGVHWTGALQD